MKFRSITDSAEARKICETLKIANLMERAALIHLAQKPGKGITIIQEVETAAELYSCFHFLGFTEDSENGWHVGIFSEFAYQDRSIARMQAEMLRRRYVIESESSMQSVVITSLN